MNAPFTTSKSCIWTLHGMILKALPYCSKLRHSMIHSARMQTHIWQASLMSPSSYCAHFMCMGLMHKGKWRHRCSVLFGPSFRRLRAIFSFVLPGALLSTSSEVQTTSEPSQYNSRSLRHSCHPSFAALKAASLDSRFGKLRLYVCFCSWSNRLTFANLRLAEIVNPGICQVNGANTVAPVAPIHILSPQGQD